MMTFEQTLFWLLVVPWIVVMNGIAIGVVIAIIRHTTGSE